MNAGEIVEKILSSINRTNLDETRKTVWSLLRLHYYRISRRTSWELMRKSMSVTAPASDTWLPSGLIDIDRVRDNSGLFDYYRRDSYDVDPDEGGYRYVLSQGSEAPLHYGLCNVTQGASALQSLSLSSEDYTGEYFRIGKELGYYKFTSAFSGGIASFTPMYTGPNISQGVLNVRPAETKKINLYDENESIISDRSVTIYYWAYPRQLYELSDEILLPDTAWLELAILRDMPEARERRPVNIGELRDAEALCLSMNKTFQRRDPSRDVRNRRFSLDGSMFGQR